MITKKKTTRKKMAKKPSASSNIVQETIMTVLDPAKLVKEAMGSMDLARDLSDHARHRIRDALEDSIDEAVDIAFRKGIPDFKKKLAERVASELELQIPRLAKEIVKNISL